MYSGSLVAMVWHVLKLQTEEEEIWRVHVNILNKQLWVTLQLGGWAGANNASPQKGSTSYTHAGDSFL
jgi:hypothetical protein